MTTARTVPVTTEMDGDELDAEDAWRLCRRTGLRRLMLDSFVRFRYADGFSHSRALAFQIALSVVPFLLALSGLAADIDHERPAAVLSDIEMPRMDGFDLVRHIRADESLASLPIIMISSRIAPKHRELARQLGVNHYLGKPYGEEELVMLIQRCTQVGES